jgi:hypothetical protein
LLDCQQAISPQQAVQAVREEVVFVPEDLGQIPDEGSGLSSFPKGDLMKQGGGSPYLDGNSVKKHEKDRLEEEAASKDPPQPLDVQGDLGSQLCRIDEFLDLSRRLRIPQ